MTSNCCFFLSNDTYVIHTDAELKELECSQLKETTPPVVSNRSTSDLDKFVDSEVNKELNFDFEYEFDDPDLELWEEGNRAIQSMIATSRLPWSPDMYDSN